MTKLAEIKKELAKVSHADDYAVKLLIELILNSGASIGLSDEQLENLENAVQSVIDQFAMLRKEVDDKLALLVLTEEKVKGYHDSVLNQISQLGNGLTALDARVKKLEPK